MMHITACFAVVNWNELIEKHFVKRLYIEGCLILKNELPPLGRQKKLKSLSVKN